MEISKQIVATRHCIFQILKHSVIRFFGFPAVYIVVSGSITIVLLSIRNTLRIIREGYLTVQFDPFVSPLITVLLINSIFISIHAVITSSQEREGGIIETLLYGPVNYRIYSWAKLFAYLGSFIIIILISFIVLWILAGATRLLLSFSLFPIAIVFFVFTLSLICLGFLCVSLVPTPRGALILFSGSVVLLAALQFGHTLLTKTISSDFAINLVLARDTFSSIHNLLNWVSPFAYLVKGLEGAVESDWKQWGTAIIVLFFSGLLVLEAGSEYLEKRGLLK